jgi:ankyrin repeat protein
VRGNHWWQVNKAIPYLVEHGADLVLDADGITPLAATLDTFKLLTFTKRAVELLIELGADVNAADDKGISCLARAGDDNELIKLLLRHGAVVTHSAIIAAINSKNAFILEALLSHGADPNIRQSINKEKPAPTSYSLVAGTGRHRPQFDPDEMYPLHYAATKDRGDDKIHEEVVKILLDHGADPNAGYAETAIMHQIIEMNRSFRLFLELPCLDLESRDSSGSTLLLAACHSQEVQKDESASIGTLSPIQILLDRGADIRARDKSGQNAPHHYFQTGLGNFTQTLDLIISKAPELVNEADSNGCTPFHTALWRLYHSSTDTEVLVSAGADLQLPKSNGDTPLHLLVRRPWLLNSDGVVIEPRRKVFNIFMEIGVNINSRNHSGETPIFELFRNHNAPVQVHHESPQPYKYKTAQETKIENMNVREELVFEILGQAGVDWSAVNNDGETLLHILAARQNHHYGPLLAIKRFKYLMGKGLDPMQEDGNQRTSLDVAAAFGNKIFLDLFERK